MKVMQVASSLQTLVSHPVSPKIHENEARITAHKTIPNNALFVGLETFEDNPSFWTDQTWGTFTSARNEDDHEQDICMCFSAESEAEYGLLGVKQPSEDADFVVC